MKRLLWLAVGPLIILALGLGLMFGLPEGEKMTPRMGKVGIVLPSGLEAEFHEMLWNQPGEGLTYRFRFVASAFEETENVELVMADLQHLCTEYALGKLSNTGPRPGQLIISLADKPSEFGMYDPDVTQVFEAFDIKSGSCIWEAF